MARPYNQAICSWDGDLTYNTLCQYSDRLAQHLVSSFNVGPEFLVPVCFYKSKWAVVTILGVMKAGGAFVFLSPFDPRSRLEALIADVNAQVVVTDSQSANIFRGLALDVVDVPSKLWQSSGDFCASFTQPHNAVYAVYTSGSTGKPKGVIVEHRALSTSLKYVGAALGYCESTRALQFSSYTFDAAILDILFTLAYGGCVCIPSEDERVDIVGAINRMRVNHAVLTPSVARDISAELLSTLKTLVLGGEAMGSRDAAQWAGKLRLINAYGPTESTIVAAYNDIISTDSRPDIIGKPVACTAWAVEVDNHDSLVATGEIGELLIQGPILARCYLNDPEMTAQAFVYPEWLSKRRTKDVQRVYKTGDLVRIDDAGNIIYVGRKDTQVKLNGQRVELGEIESSFRDHDLIDTAVVLLNWRPCVKGLVAVTTMHNDSRHKATSLGLHLIVKDQSVTVMIGRVYDDLVTRLPSHMIPATWLVVEHIPLQRSGKLDRKAVEQWVMGLEDDIVNHNALNAQLQEEPDRSLTPMETKLRSAICRVLNLDPDQVHSNQSFSSLGGDSIAAMAVQNILRNETVRIRYQDLIRRTPLVALAEMASFEAADTSIGSEIRDDPFSLLPVQQLYFSQPKLPSRFHSSMLVRLLEDVDCEFVALTVESLVNRHPMLRARFCGSQKGWRQRTVKDVPESYQYTFVEVANQTHIKDIIAKDQSTIDIVKGPVFVATLIDIKSNNQKTFSMVAPHLVTDLISWQIILNDLDQLLQGKHLRMNPLYSFRNWCELQAEQVRTISPKQPYYPPASIEYWGMGDQPNNFGDILAESFQLNSHQTNNLIQHCTKALHAAPVDIFVAAASFSFSCIFSNRAPPTFYCLGHGREASNDNVDLSSTVGWFNTFVPINIQKQRSTFVETLRAVGEVRKSIPGNGQQYFAYRCLHPAVRDSIEEYWNIEIFFNYTGSQRLDHGLRMLRQESWQGGNGAEDIGMDVRRLSLLDVLVDVNDGELMMTILYNKWMKRQEGIHRWVGECEKVLLELLDQNHEESKGEKV
ncbi:hypothetical protein MMC21_003130 [Puttea exsequens]|nr:hypothetical protein [Puttea exsequens]